MKRGLLVMAGTLAMISFLLAWVSPDSLLTGVALIGTGLICLAGVLWEKVETFLVSLHPDVRWAKKSLTMCDPWDGDLDHTICSIADRAGTTVRNALYHEIDVAACRWHQEDLLQEEAFRPFTIQHTCGHTAEHMLDPEGDLGFECAQLEAGLCPQCEAEQDTRQERVLDEEDFEEWGLLIENRLGARRCQKEWPSPRPKRGRRKFPRYKSTREVSLQKKELVKQFYISPGRGYWVPEEVFPFLEEYQEAGEWERVEEAIGLGLKRGQIRPLKGAFPSPFYSQEEIEDWENVHG